MRSYRDTLGGVTRHWRFCYQVLAENIHCTAKASSMSRLAVHIDVYKK